MANKGTNSRQSEPQGNFSIVCSSVVQGERVEQTGEGDDVKRRVVAMLQDSVEEAGEGKEEGGLIDRILAE